MGIGRVYVSYFKAENSQITTHFENPPAIVDVFQTVSLPNYFLSLSLSQESDLGSLLCSAVTKFIL